MSYTFINDMTYRTHTINISLQLVDTTIKSHAKKHFVIASKIGIGTGTVIGSSIITFHIHSSFEEKKKSVNTCFRY